MEYICSSHPQSPYATAAPVSSARLDIADISPTWLDEIGRLQFLLYSNYKKAAVAAAAPAAAHI
ncbi:MAG TPA: hypothetical protein EYP23_05795 [Thermoplasmata archaeon]|nr:hypothetical protein [Thermoplasmata archaeon]